MTSSTLNRITKIFVLGAIVAGVLVPAAGAVNALSEDGSSVTTAGSYVGSPPDVRDAASALSNSTTLGRKADGLRLQAIAQAYQSQQAAVPDAFERYSSAHPYGTGVTQVSSPEAVRPPDIRDVADSVRAIPLTPTSNGFDWSDYAIGLGSGIGFVLLLGSALMLGVHQRRHIQTA